MKSMLQNLQDKFIGNKVTYTSYHFDHDLPAETGHVSNVKEFVYDGVLKGYTIEFDNLKISPYTLKFDTIRFVDLNKEVVKLTPSYYEAHGTTTWAIQKG
jgi:hypothetical protein